MAKELIKELKEYDAECIILGCTELPIPIAGMNHDVLLIDSNEVLARESIRQINNLK